jgi:isopenicillin N synthase-like dioxygenase
MRFRETMSSNCKEVRELGFQLHAAMSESIGLEPGYMKDTLGEQDQHMAVNFNPPCPSPELTCGLLAHHTDPNANALTILLMDEDVAGLQVLHGGKWVAVNPHPGALIVGIDDDHLLQVIDVPNIQFVVDALTQTRSD